MIIIITGATHTGKTKLAQMLLEKYKYPYLSIDHLKMGLIRSKNTKLTPLDDDKLTSYLWPILKGMIATAIENSQHMIIEGCYIPFNWRDSFSNQYLNDIKFICLAFSESYIDNNFSDILKYRSVIENRLTDDVKVEELKRDNKYYIDGFSKVGEKVIIIKDYKKDIEMIMDGDL